VPAGCRNTPARDGAKAMRLRSVVLLVIGCLCIMTGIIGSAVHALTPMEHGKDMGCRIHVRMLVCHGNHYDSRDFSIVYVVEPREKWRPVLDGDRFTCHRNIRRFPWGVRFADNKLTCVGHDLLKELKPD
jgi:hypothetical protein